MVGRWHDVASCAGVKLSKVVAVGTTVFPSCSRLLIARWVKELKVRVIVISISLTRGSFHWSRSDLPLRLTDIHWENLKLDLFVNKTAVVVERPTNGAIVLA